MKQKSVGLTLRAAIIALALILVAGSPALPPFDGVAYAQDAPQNLEATPAPDNNSVTLRWDAVSGADNYQVVRGDGSGQSVQWPNPIVPIATVPGTETTYTDSTVTAGNTYSYAVRAVAGGTTGAYSNVPSVTLVTTTPAPTGIPSFSSVTADGIDAVDVSWSSVSGATHYHLQYWYFGLGNSWERIPGNLQSPYKHEDLTAGRQYFYSVRAVNAGGEGTWSAPNAANNNITLQATTTVPVLTLTHSSRTVVQLSWTSSAAGSTYNLHRRKLHVADSADAVTEDTTTAWAALLSGSTATSHTDNNATFQPTNAERVMYEYRVQAIDSNNIAGDWSGVKSVNVPAAGAILSAPTISAASAVSSSSTRATWGAVAGAAFYELHWKTGDGNYTTPIRVDALSYEHLSLNPATTYTYQVRAVDINGPSAWSAARSATTLSVTAAAGQMPKVTGLTVTDATTSNTGLTRTAKLTWNAVSGATDYDIQRYDPSTPAGWQDLANSAGSTRIDAEASPSYEDEFADGDDAQGKTFFYVVSAVDDRSTEDEADTDAGNDDLGEWSDHKSVTFIDFVPAAPTGLAASRTNGNSILVRWAQADAAGTNGTATSWTIHYRTSATTSWTAIAVTGGTPSYHHTGLRGNTTYFYRVRAENSGGESAFHPAPGETQISVTLGNTLTAPSNVTAAAESDTEIKVSWNAVTGADSYQLQRFNPAATEGVDPWGALDGTAGGNTPVETGTEHTDTGRTASTAYLYRVRTVQETETSGWSTVASGTTRAEAPAVPTLVATTTGQSMIRLSWTAVEDATVYHLEFLVGVQAHADFEDVNTTPTRRTISGNFNNYVHTGLSAGTQYSYRLRAVLSTGNGDWTSAGNNPQTVQPFTKPASPDLTVTTTDHDTLSLTWDAVSFGTGEVGVSALGGYRIERRVANSGAAWTSVSDTLVTNACDTKCSYEDSGTTDEPLTPSTHYQYRIRAESSSTATDSLNSYWDYANQRTTAAPSN